jgi:hypothetical protein
MICDHVNQVREWGNMPNGEYGPSLWGCKNCNETSIERLPTEEIKSGSHWDICIGEGCQTCKYLSVGLGVGTMPTRHPSSAVTEAREKRWEKDMPAYKRMRQQGLQPKTIDGAAHIEAKAETRFEVESGQVLPGQSKKIETAVSAIESITGKSVYAPDTKPVNL